MAGSPVAPVPAARGPVDMRSPWRAPARRRILWFVLIVLVVLLHLVVGAATALTVVGWQASPEPRRIDVSLVRELEPAAPPPAPAAPLALPAEVRSARAAPVARAASTPRTAQAAPPPDDEHAARAETAASAADARKTLREEALALAASLEASAAAGAPSAPAAPTATSAPSLASVASSARAASGASRASATQPALDWPPSTRLTYTLSGDWGSNHLFGNAVVDWRREGLHYQVEFAFHFGSLFEQRMFSDGRIGEQGLAPSHFEQTRRVTLAEPRTSTLDFVGDDVVLSNGRHLARLPGTQDSASQFVQFVWMFTSHPDWLRPGTTLTIPLALVNSLHAWQYRVGETERLDLGFGALDAVHLTPIVTERRPNEYPFEIWIAPTLQYLPVQVRVDLQHGSYGQLTLDHKPLQAAYPNQMPRSQRDDLP
ncbi:MAG TPA: DUF3108 domain-containing protein [Burkholderiaceae bacterium]|nr:DUF3108 domain-containing protein [Burkholderiaceae bacterium]